MRAHTITTRPAMMTPDPDLSGVRATRRETSLYRLLSIATPSLPTGAFAYSGGLEAAVNARRIMNGAELQAWLEDALARGSSWNDALYCAAAWRAGDDINELRDVSAHCRAASASKTRLDELDALGSAALAAAARWPGLSLSLKTGPYPVAIGHVARRLDAPLIEAVTALLHAVVANSLQVAMRLAPIDQFEAVEIQAALEPTVLDVAARTAERGLDALGAATIMIDIASAEHETLSTRIFRS